MKQGSVKFNAEALRKVLTKKLTEEQTARLIDYAKNKIIELGNTIQSYHSRNNMDRSGNLLNSLCWGVAYDGELKASGFYRDAILKTHSTWNEKNTTNAYLHEWIPEYEAFPVNGRQEAQAYISRYGKVGSNGGYWRVFFAILAPYWGYWESGFRMKHNIGGGVSFHRFAVMSQLYDQVSRELKPAKTSFRVTKDINYTKSYKVKGIKNSNKARVRGSIERRYDSWMRKQK